MNEWRPSIRWTSRVLSGGTAASVVCLLVGVLLSLGDAGDGRADPRRVELVLASAARFEPWGWSMLGVLVLLATPALGLLASALELRRGQPAVALVALVVLAILAAAAVGALVA